MKIKVSFLAHYRELAGSSWEMLELEHGTTVGMLLDELCRQFPRLTEHRDEALISVNKKQALAEQELHTGDEIVLFPPAVGG
jgi:sulfur-carrier protein